VSISSFSAGDRTIGPSSSELLTLTFNDVSWGVTFIRLTFSPSNCQVP
jgi:hypothetical protein